MNLDHLRKAKDQAFKEYDFKAFVYEKKRDDKTISEDEVKKAYDDALAKYMEMTTINKQYDEFLNSTTGMFN